MATWYERNLKTRNLVLPNEKKSSYFQIIGFVLILLGLVSISIAVYFDKGNLVALSFFMIMMGILFVFPDLLMDKKKDISTMRIAVFLVVNVFCLLVINIGWNKDSFQQIGLDQYWVAILVFAFGAKVMQAYFENAKLLLPSNQQAPTSKEQILISKIAIAQIAKVQNEEKLHEEFPSIEFASDTVRNGESYLTLYLKDDNTKGIPSFVIAEINETTVVKVKTEIVTNIGEGKPHFAQLNNNIADSNTPQFLGSICCLVESTVNSNVKGIITSGHIFTDGKFIDFDGFVGSNQAFDTLSNNNSIGELYFQQMIPNQDLAVVKLNDTTTIPAELMKFTSGFYNVSQSDLNSPAKNVTILSKGNNRRDAFIVDLNVSMRLYYVGTQKIIRNIILIGSDTDKNKSTTVSVSGDSGSCVYHKESRKMIGMLLGGNDKFSFVLPFEQTLNNNNFKIK